MSNPYATPEAVLSESAAGDETYDPKFFALHGRIGRLRFFAYNSLATILLTFVVGILLAVLIPVVAVGAKSPVAGFLAMAIAYIPILGAALIITKRRFNDLNRSGWWALLLLVPFVNFVAWLYLQFGPGTEGPNDYGLPPSKNSVLLVIAGLIVPVIIVGILAAVAIPAYQSYVQRAKLAQQKTQIEDPHRIEDQLR